MKLYIFNFMIVHPESMNWEVRDTTIVGNSVREAKAILKNENPGATDIILEDILPL